LLRSEKIRVGTFVLVVAAVYIAAGILTVRWARRHFTREATPAAPAEIRFRGPIFALAGLGLLCLAYGRFVEPYWLEVTHVRIESPKLPPGTRPIRIVHLSDLHSESTPRLEERLIPVIAAERPDLIVFTGDAINPRRGLPIFQRCLTRLASTAPTFGVRGNWDIQPWEKLDLFGNTGAHELKGEAAQVKIEGTHVWLAGVPWGGTEHIGEALSGVPAGAFTVFLYQVPTKSSSSRAGTSISTWPGIPTEARLRFRSTGLL
jgi:hypothetical protein